MNESEFNRIVDDVLTQIEDALEASGADVDYETVAGILTVEFEDGSKIIVNRQTPVRQIWVAARSGGYHYDYDAEHGIWRSDNDGEELFAALGRHCSRQAGSSIELKAE